jgi:hypothetical protein
LFYSNAPDYLYTNGKVREIRRETPYQKPQAKHPVGEGKVFRIFESGHIFSDFTISLQLISKTPLAKGTKVWTIFKN